MKIERIVLDLDDVLNMLSLDILRFYGVSLDSYDDWPVDVGFPVKAALSALTGQPEIDTVPFWEAIPRSLWAGATPTPEIYDIIEWCEHHVGRDNILIGTTPTKCADCLAGKYVWMERYLPVWLHRQYAITPRKWWFARHDTVLLDDNEENCENMRNNGGHAIEVPRPWNKNVGKDTLSTLQNEFERLHECSTSDSEVAA